MSLYMTQFACTTEAWKAFAKNPEDRSSVFRELVERLGAQPLSFCYCFGEYDGVVILRRPMRLLPRPPSSPLSRRAT